VIHSVPEAPLLQTRALFGNPGISALSAAEWRKQSIYQVVTSKVARPDLSTTRPCDPASQVYCRGAWPGLISNLDYTKGVEFTACGSRGLSSRSMSIRKTGKPALSLQLTGPSVGKGLHAGRPTTDTELRLWQDIWAVNSAFRTEADLAELSAELHAGGVMRASLQYHLPLIIVLICRPAGMHIMVDFLLTTWRTWAAVPVSTTAGSTLFISNLCPHWARCVERNSRLVTHQRTLRIFTHLAPSITILRH
jgi:hypothetical protein